MKFIPRRLHIVLDLVLILILLAWPWLFFPYPHGMETLVFLVTGGAMLWYSLMTKYELGIFRFMNLKNHLTLDFLLGFFLFFSPWLVGFGTRMIWPHVILGTSLMLLASFSSNRSAMVTAQEQDITF